MNLSVLESIMKTYLKSLLSVPYIPEHFLSPDGYTSGHVARIQLYTCHHLELPPLERHLYSSSHSTKLPIQGVTWCRAYLGARPLKWRARGVTLHTFSVVSPAAITIYFTCIPCMFWETVPLPRPLVREWSSDNLILPCCVTSISPVPVLVPLGNLKQAFLIFRRCGPFGSL